MAAYYNEIDRFAAAWLRELIKAGHIAPGDVDERSIEDVQPDDLRGYTQCHFFAGIGVWSYALRRAGWADDVRVWTGSCPCQSFSASGKRGGFSDKRHLWPAWFRLIQECRPDVCFGEQVASKDGLAWLDIVSSDLEASGYTFGAADMCAAGVGAPHIRQRTYFLADSEHARLNREKRFTAFADSYKSREWLLERDCSARDGSTGDVEHPNRRGPQIRRAESCGRVGERTAGIALRENFSAEIEESGSHGDMGKSARDGRNEGRAEPERQQGRLNASESGFTNGYWRDAEWLYCRDEKYRPVEPGTFPLASGATNRVGRLRGYGNAINAEVAKEFIAAYMEICQ